MFDPPRSAQFDDVYFSVHNGAEETKHVFFDGNNLPARWQGRDRFCIAETGFGTGLNFLLTWELFEKTVPQGAFLDFISFEKYPLSAQDIENALTPWADKLHGYTAKLVKSYPLRVPGFHRIVFDNRVALTLIFDDVNTAMPELDARVDAWFLDGFTPSKNPDMWSDTVFSNMARLSKAGASFATFTSAGFVKRGLQAAGFAVEKVKGFAYKRDMLKGTYTAKEPCCPSHTPSIKTVLIHGAGFAGCTAAYVLKQYGFDPVLYDPHGIASGASGNQIGLINPRLSAYRSPESDFYTSGFAQAVRSYKNLVGAAFTPCGAMHLAHDDDKQKRFLRTVEHWGWDKAHMKYLSAREASEVADIDVPTDALYLPDAGHVCPVGLCHAMADCVPVLFQKPDGDFDAEILAIGAGSVGDVRLAGLPVHTVRGQVTLVRETEDSRRLKTNLCYGGYMSAARGDVHAVGSTFQKWLSDTALRPEDDADNLQKLSDMFPTLGGFEIMGHRAALRTSAKDRFPIIGGWKGGYVSIAHGSHGAVSAIVGAHYLADLLRDGPRCLPRAVQKALSPLRFRAV